MVCQFGGTRGITNSDSLGSAKDGFGSVKTLRNLRYVKYAGLTAWLLALIFIILINIGRSYASNQSDQAGAEAGLSTLATTATGPAKVGMSDPGDVSLSAIAEGGIVTGGHNLTVSSTSVAGYKVAMESDGALKDDSFAGRESTSNTLIMSTTGGTLTAPAPLTNNSWGVAIVGNSSFDDVAVYQSTDQSVLSKAKFAPIPGRSGDNPDGQVIFSGNAATTGDTRTIYYGVKTDPYFRAGNYSATVVYTITAELPDTPTITSVTPDSYQLESGASGQITIEGTNLSSAYSVYLTNASGDTVGDCTNLNVVGDTQLTCTIPTTGISAGDYTIHVVTQGGEATIGFSYVEPVLTNTSADNYGSSVGHVQVDWDANMIPVTYNNGHWEALTNAEIKSDPKNWYDYVNKVWANAVTVKKEKLSTYKNKSSRIAVQEDDILGHWVYVPRYAYLVKRRDAVDSPVQAQNFQIRFETSADSTKIPRSTCSKSTSPVSHKNYLSCSGVSQTYGATTGTAWATHPAFNWGDKKLNGIWVAKFEMTGARTEPTVKPNSKSNVLEDVGTLYTMAKNIGYPDPQNTGGLSIAGIKSNYHSLVQATSHLIKNTEWGAAAYLAASQYGAGYNGMMPNTAEAPSGTDADGDGKESSWDELMGITGCGPSSASSKATYQGESLTVSNPSSSTACGSVDRAYNGSIGQLASTTRNIYGVYDMAGGAYEIVAGNTPSQDNLVQDEEGIFGVLIGEPYVDLYRLSDGFPENSSWDAPSWSGDGSSGYPDMSTWGIDVCTFETCGGTALHEVGTTQSASPNYYSGWLGSSHAFPWGREGNFLLRGGGARNNGSDGYVYTSSVLAGYGGNAWSGSTSRPVIIVSTN